MENRSWAKWGVVAASCVLCLIATTAATASETSALWGKNGEKWNPQSRLPDFSYAGYHCGEAPLPDPPRGVSVKEFGRRATASRMIRRPSWTRWPSGPSAIEVPAGRDKIKTILEIKRPGVVLRGAGPDKSVLYFPITLTDIKPDWVRHDHGRTDLELFLVRRVRLAERKSGAKNTGDGQRRIAARRPGDAGRFGGFVQAWAMDHDHPARPWRQVTG